MKHFNILIASAAVILVTSVGAHAENTLRWTSQGDALTLDPHSQNEGPTIAMNGTIYESLVTRDAALKLQPELAESWTAAPDGWTFKLRKGVKFHDGADFTAEDVVFSFGRAKATSSDFKEQAKNVTKVEAIDDHTVKLFTDGPNPILPNQLTSIYMMDKGWAEKNNVAEPQDFKAKQETFAVRNANGTGPFKLVSRAPDEKTVLERNADWWGNDQFPGNIDKIEYRPIANAATRVAALLSGEVDFVLDPPLQDLKRIESSDGLKVDTVAQIRSIFFGMDQGVEELRSSNVKGQEPASGPACARSLQPRHRQGSHQARCHGGPEFSDRYDHVARRARQHAGERQAVRSRSGEGQGTAGGRRLSRRLFDPARLPEQPL